MEVPPPHTKWMKCTIPFGSVTVYPFYVLVVDKILYVLGGVRNISLELKELRFSIYLRKFYFVVLGSRRNVFSKLKNSRRSFFSRSFFSQIG